MATATRGIDLIGPTVAPTALATNARKAYHHHGISAANEAPMVRYDPATNTVVCLQGQSLTDDVKYERNGTLCHRYRAQDADCHACAAKAQCCPRARHGRSIERRELRPAIAAFRQHMETDGARAIYRARPQVAEFSNLWIKAKLGVRQFRVRGCANVRLEAVWAALTYSIQQWLRLRTRPPHVAPVATA